MNKLKEKMKGFNQRWKAINDIDPEEEFKKFRVRILNIFGDIDHEISREDISSFCQYFWIIEKRVEDFLWWSGRSYNIINKLSSERQEIELFRIIEIIFSLDFYYWSHKKEQYITLFKQALEFSTLNVSILHKNWEIILYPAWEEKLDQELVNNVLSFLNWSSDKHFRDALWFYQSKLYEKTAESLRRCLEEYLRIVLNNSKWLNGNIPEITKKIKWDSNAKIRNIITQIFSYLDTYFNDNSKHNDWVTEEDAEFLIYQIALLMRYISRF